VNDNLRLLIKKDALEKMKSGEVARAEAEMRAEIEKQEQLQISRRAKQEQVLAARAKKKAEKNEAKTADALLAARCSALEAALDARIGKKEVLAELERQKAVLQHKIQDAVARRRKAQAKEHDLSEEYRTLVQRIEQTNKPDTGDEERELLKQAFDASEAAWANTHKAFRKKTRDRALKKRAKGLLGL